jgi:hypothetical protein
MINLMEDYGLKYKVKFEEKDSYYRNNEVAKTEKQKVPKEYFYQLKCLKGFIVLFGGDILTGYFKSAIVAKKFIKEHHKKLIFWDLYYGEPGGMIRFHKNMIKNVFEYMKPRRRKQYSEEDLQKKREMMNKYWENKKKMEEN